MSDDQEVLRERARLLARRVATQQVERLRLLGWRRGDERFAIDLDAVRAVAPAGCLAAVPHPPPLLAGVAAFRGDLLPVYDPRPLLAAAGEELPAVDDDEGWLVVVDDPDASFGLLADGLPDLLETREEELRPASADLPAEARRCVRAVTRAGHVLLHADALRRDPRLRLLPGPDLPTAAEAAP